ncbi:carboxylesterase/lipase family protein [Compostimonas suwonensis]|uniref:Carboxylic ester hydrolase n=1 Tax=Compostimonas suwonensis TaxID=1048394 RepID=A0A2M9BZ39_9MICO|nr:carboxylesterase/lipase family protein [Compostimonas suwonensis]PJJ63348.1 para-nitrobenzyl esterase [Compostimonas suwonensis]
MSDVLTVSTPSGPVRGTLANGVAAWKGIPYAAPPTGALRFRSPQPPEPWTEVFDASSYGPAAPQLPNPAVAVDPALGVDEDCLSINVWAPEPDGRKRPVMVWVHGGAYFVGASSQRLYDATSLVTHGDLIVVTFNYRLGVFGFLDLSSLSTPGDEFETNLGLRDQIAALRWVRESIEAFGGDPERVTIAGESAGGGAVTSLMVSPAASGLFQRAIAESSPATSVYGPERSTQVAEAYLELLGVEAKDAATLRELPWKPLVEAAAALTNQHSTRFPGTIAMAPVVDGDILPHYPVGAFQKGLAHPVPLLIGTNRDEAALFRYMKSPIFPTTATAINEMFAAIGSDHPGLVADEKLITDAYKGFPRRSAAMEIARDAAFRMPTLWLAEAHSRTAPVYLYRFDQTTPMLAIAGIGASHGTELAYVWGNFELSKKDPTFRLGGRKDADQVSQRMQARWAAFIHGEAPDGDGLVDWRPFTADDRATLLIGKHDELADDPDATIRAAWGDTVIAFS